MGAGLEGTHIRRFLTLSRLVLSAQLCSGKRRILLTEARVGKGGAVTTKCTRSRAWIMQWV